MKSVETKIHTKSLCDKCNTPNSSFNPYLQKYVICLCKCEVAARDKKIAEEENKEQLEKLSKLYTYSLMDQSSKDKTFKNFDFNIGNRKLYNFAKKYCDNWEQVKKENIGAMITGDTGIGKTYITYCIANELLSKYVPIVMTSSINLLNTIKDRYSANGQEAEIAVMRELNKAHLLILDDLGAEHNTEWTRSKIYEILDNRIRQEKPIIVTSNFTVEQLRRQFSDNGVERTLDRLLMIAPPMKFEGESIRIKVAKNKMKIFNDMED